MDKLRGGFRSWAQRLITISLVPFLIPMCFNPLIKDGALPSRNASSASAAGPAIQNISDNRGAYPNSSVPSSQKIEITFQVNTQAANLQLPYDDAPPPGVQKSVGISVDGLFSLDNWQTVYTQPAFYYEDYLDQVKDGREWFYPSGTFNWKIRFSPDRAGDWQYKIRAKDSSGLTVTSPVTFPVAALGQKGSIRVSPRDPRYFEYQDGTYFPSLGYNLNFDQVSWINPVLDNQDNFEKMSQDGIQLVRIWLSQWSIYGSGWSPWESIDPNLHAQYIPYTGLTFDQAYSGSDVSMQVNAEINPCMFLGFMQAGPAVKQNTNYRVRIRYRTSGIIGPKVAGRSYGFVAKLSNDWLWGDGNNCNEPGNGQAVTSYQPQATSGWQILEGSFNSGSNNFLPFFYLVMDNAAQGKAYVDYVWIEENLGNGQYGPNIVSKPWMAQHQYMDQRNSYAFDKVISLAEKNGITIRPVVLEKNDFLYNHIDYNGNAIADNPRCYDDDTSNDPAKCPGNDWFYGNYQTVTKVRWLQQAWWRYLQARWGYSTSIHSWELLNEGDPYDERHYSLANEFAIYMHQFKPDDHLVSTSFWHSFPRDEFWANPAYQTIDFADIHQYVPSDDPLFGNTAEETQALSMQYGAEQWDGAGKPVIRGETGFTDSGSEPPPSSTDRDTQGIWLHNFVWGGINSGGLIESYWYANSQIYRVENGTTIFDHRPIYKTYYDFIKDIPLSNGNYQDAMATVNGNGLRVWGQKDVIGGQAHLWIQNEHHTWQAVIDGANIQSVSGTITVSGFKPETDYRVEYWDTYQTDTTKQVVRAENITSSSAGDIDISVSNLKTDFAVKVQSKTVSSADKRIFLPMLLSH